jgi:hypothetical protein
MEFYMTKRNKKTESLRGNSAPEHQPIAASTKATKASIILELLKRDQGATLQHMQDATGWQAHSLRGFLSATVKKQMALNLERTLCADGTSSYHIRGGVA